MFVEKTLAAMDSNSDRVCDARCFSNAEMPTSLISQSKSRTVRVFEHGNI